EDGIRDKLVTGVQTCALPICLYGLWKGGGWVGDHWIEGTYEDHLAPFLDELKKPALVTLHTVLPEPSPAIRDAMRSIAELAHGQIGRASCRERVARPAGGGAV